MRKKYAIGVFLIIILLIGCTQKAPEIEGPVKTVVDSVGREVTIPQNPERLGALYAPTGHIIAMLDSGDKIVAVNNGLKRDKLLNQLVPAIGEASRVVSSGQINMEELAKLEVDLAFIPLDIYREEKQVKQLGKLGIPYIVVDFQSIEEQKSLVSLMGEILGAEEEAQTYNDFYDNVIAQTKKAVESVTMDKRTRVYHSINEANCTVASNTLPADWMHIAGGVNVSLDTELEKDGDKYYTNLEQIIYWNPDVIYCNEEGVPAYIMNNDQWSDIAAIKSGRVLQLPVGISRWGHKTSLETPLAILYVAQDLYPQAMQNVDVEAMIRSFYSDLFEFDVTDADLESILEGKAMRLTKDLKEGE